MSGFKPLTEDQIHQIQIQLKEGCLDPDTVQELLDAYLSIHASHSLDLLGDEEIEREIKVRSLATRVSLDDDNLETAELDEGFRQGARWLRSRIGGGR